jgi:aldehyde dehydrogenase (NAD+)
VTWTTAVRAVRRAFDEGPWPHTRASERLRVLRTIADLVRAHGDELKTVLLPFTDEMM